MVKRLFIISCSYGKGEGEKEIDRFVLEDTKDARAEILEEYNSTFSTCFDREEFINGDTDLVDIDKDFADWDEPNGIHITVYDKQEMINKVKARYESEMSDIERIFKEDD